MQQQQCARVAAPRLAGPVLTVAQTLHLAQQLSAASTGHIAKPALQLLVAAERTHGTVHRGLLALSGLLVLVPALQPELLTAMALALRTRGQLAEALTVERQRARLGTLQARPTTLPAIIRMCLGLGVGEITAGLQVALALLPAPRRRAIALPDEAGVSPVAHMPLPDAPTLAQAQRYVHQHVPGLLELFADVAAGLTRAEQARHLAETTILECAPTTLNEKQQGKLSAHQCAVQLAHAAPEQQDKLLRVLLRRRHGSVQVLMLTEQLLLCAPSAEALATTLRGHLVALREVGGLLALAATLLQSEATFFAHLALFVQLPDVSPAEDPLALRWLWSRLWERHPLARDVPLAIALLGRSADADVRLGIELAVQLTPDVAWAQAALKRAAPAEAALVAEVEQRVPGLRALLGRVLADRPAKQARPALAAANK